MLINTTTMKSRRNRLSPYTAAERRQNKAGGLGVSTHHRERGLSRRSYARKAQS